LEVVYLNREVIAALLIGAGWLLLQKARIAQVPCTFDTYWIVLVFSLIFTFIIGLEVVK